RVVGEALGPSWRAADLRGLERAYWVHAGALARSDFPAETLAALARDRRLSFDGQGLVRPARTGPLVLDAEYDPEVLRHVSVLKLAEEEARVLVDEPDAEALASLRVRPHEAGGGAVALVGGAGALGRVGPRGRARLRRRPAGAGSGAQAPGR